MYTLIGSLRSPFVRACRMLLIQNGIPFEFRILNFADDPKDAKALEAETPINKVPLLIDGDQRIFDSRVIQVYLTHKHGLRRLSLDEENLLTSVYSCLDTGVLLFLMKRDGIDVNAPGFFVSRNRDRIPRNLEFVRSWVRGLQPHRSEDWNFVSMSLYSFFYWAQARSVYDHSSDADFTDFMERFKDCPGVAETGF